MVLRQKAHALLSARVVCKKGNGLNIIITSINTTNEGNEIVTFTCPAGMGAALWNSTTYRAIVGHEYSIELDFDTVSSVDSAVNSSFSLTVKDNYVIVTGMVDGIDDDGLFYFRLDPSCLIMVEAIPNRPVSQNEWLTIKVKSTCLSMFPFGE